MSVIAPTMPTNSAIPATIEPSSNVAGQSQTLLPNNQVTKIPDVTTTERINNSKLLKVLAVILIVVGIAVLLAAAAITVGLIAKGTALVQHMPYMVVGLTIMGPTGAKIAAICCAVFGGLGTWGGFALWRNTDNLHTTVTKTVQGDVVQLPGQVVQLPGQVVQLPGQVVQLPGEVTTVSVAVNIPVPTPPPPAPSKPAPVYPVKPPVQTQWGNNQAIQSKMNFSNKQIDEVPPFVYINTSSESLKFIENIKILWLQNNDITELPDGIDTLRNLEELDISNNKFKNLKNIEKLTGLKKLNITGNPGLNSVASIEALGKLLSNKEILIEVEKDKHALFNDLVAAHPSLKMS